MTEHNNSRRLPADLESENKEEVQSIPPSGAEKNAGGDYWTVRGETLIRHHVTPRTKIFTPTEVTCPMPPKFLDVMRSTRTDLDSIFEADIEDF